MVYRSYNIGGELLFAGNVREGSGLEPAAEAQLIRGLGPKAADRARRRDWGPGAGLDLGDLSTGSTSASSGSRQVLTVICCGQQEELQVEVPESATAGEVRARSRARRLSRSMSCLVKLKLYNKQYN